MPAIIKVAIAPFETPYSYQVSENLAESLCLGSRIKVNFRGKLKDGIVVELNAKHEADTSYKIKEIEDTAPFHHCLSPEQFKFTKWIAEYYQESQARLLPNIIPKYYAVASKARIDLIATEQEAEDLKGKQQKLIIDYLKQHQGSCSKKKLLVDLPKAHATLRKLVSKKIVRIVYESNKQIFDGFKFAKQYPSKEVQLNSEQQKAYQKIAAAQDENRFETFLLYGVTGSGKTEVYLDLCEKAVANGKGVMLLVPEIALTPQLIDRFASRLKTNFAILHSDLSSKDRWQAWQSLLEGEVQVVIGVRSAVFAPIDNLGLIIVDEEHDGSYKQSDNFRYQARDLAVKRAQLNNCPVVLGSATPTLESIYNYKLNKYTLLRLSHKHSVARDNIIQTIDLGKLKKTDYATPNISKSLAEAIALNLQQGQQTFILYNRRGFASYLECDRCCKPIKCPHCDLTLTYYQHKLSLLCHSCGYQIQIPKSCLNCKRQIEILEHPLSGWVMRGAGTEKIDQELSSLFPTAKIERLDRDLVKSSEEFRAILANAQNQKIDILIGTQMIAKGHDLPNVTLVGVVDCDVGLNFPDFRASERIFQLLTQVAGRAGRGDLPGKVIFQTRQVTHPSIVHAKNDDYLGFVNQELLNRQLLNYPPFTKILRIIISSEDENFIPKFLQQLHPALLGFIEKQKLDLKLLGPVVAPLSKVRKHYRWHYLCKSTQLKNLQKIMRFFNHLKSKNKKVRISLDLDPQDLL